MDDNEKLGSAMQMLGLSPEIERARFAELFEKYSKATYLDVRLDPGFKRLLKNEAAMVSFLNAILHRETDFIKSVEFMDTDIEIHATDLLNLRMDIHAKTESGLHINVEMQKLSLTLFNERAILQESAFLCVEKKRLDAKIKEKYPSDSAHDIAEREKHRYEIPHVYAVWICDFNVNEIGEYYDSWHIYSDEAVKRSATSATPLPVTEKVKYIVVDLKKFKKTASELENDEDRWLYLIKNAGVMKKLPKFNDSVLDDAVKRITIDANRDKKILEDQVSCTISIDEQIGRMVLAHFDGKNEGRIEGKNEAKYEAAEAFLREGDPAERVARVLKLPLEKVQELADKIAAEKSL
ncbi:MAG: Rpn family recombination-promoting nuclease/putative transposase [Fibrobacter sp.]|nr:Rpn family recombination-promoting nuclease/putative transposase [Fibrobacter sp.]